MNTQNIYEIEMAAINAVADMEDRGIRVDLEYLKGIKDTLDAIVSKTEEDAKALAPNLNIASSSQVFAYFKGTETPLVESADESELQKISDKSPLAALILNYRKHKKLLTTYVESLLNLQLQGIVHPSFRTIEAATGRLSCSEPNLQNIPRVEGDFSIRRAFIPREGCSLYAADYNQQELRLLVNYTRDKKLIGLFNKSNPDFHTDTATILNIPRTQAKTINFAIAYGAGKKKIASSLGVSLEEGGAVVDKYFQKFSAIKSLIRKTSDTAESRGYIRTFFGRRRILHYQQGINVINESNKALNTIIQGTAADIMKIMLVKINNFLKYREGVDYPYPYGVRILLSIHDEIIIEVPNGQEGLVPFIKETLEYLPMFDVPMVVDVSLCSPSWATKTKITKEQLEEWKTKPVSILPEDTMDPYKLVPIEEPNLEDLERDIESFREEQPVSFNGSLFSL